MKDPAATKATVSSKRVLDAAARLFRDRGYVATTMRDIARQAGMKAGSIYYHYSSKEKLLDAVLDRGTAGVFSGVREAVERLPPKATHREKLHTAITAHLHSIVKFGDYTLVSRRILGQIPTAIRKKNLKLRESYGRFWRDLFESARLDGAFRDDADISMNRMFVISIINGTIEWYDPAKRPLDDVATEITRLLFDGLNRPDGAVGATDANGRSSGRRSSAPAHAS